MKLHNTAILLSIILLLHSCNNVDEFSGGKTSGESPILISAEPAEPFSRGYIPTGMYDNFKIIQIEYFPKLFPNQIFNKGIEYPAKVPAKTAVKTPTNLD